MCMKRLVFHFCMLKIDCGLLFSILCYLFGDILLYSSFEVILIIIF